ncbi:MAG: ABC transporter substrate-binding protein [Methylococcaceae bacterium]|nr:ABC transporter substrate-binding protein [Methylococcaceae bacterium]
MNRRIQKTFFLILLWATSLVNATTIQTIKIAYITQEQKVPAALSNLDAFIQQKGLIGAEIAIADNNTTGQFTGQKFNLQKIIVPVSADVVTVFKQLVMDDTFFVITNLPADLLIRLADLDSAKRKLFFDATTTDDELRNSHCRKNILHMLPSRAMRADALAQYMMKKRWKKWFLVTGMSNEDQAYARAIKRAAERFGMKIVTEKQWTHTYDARRTAQSDVPVFTQGVEYDVLVVADEQGLFGEYFQYRSWIPRPVIGTQGLVPTSWHRTHEQWGAVQVQNRFKELAGRWMEEQDYGAYLAVRSIGEASVRTESNQMQILKNYLLGDEFALQGYKGKPLSFRSWNGQLRQPVLLAAARSLVTVAPIEGFLHPKTELDTLGFDQAESTCMNGSKNTNLAPLAIQEDKQSEGENKLQKLKQQIINKLKQFGWK